MASENEKQPGLQPPEGGGQSQGGAYPGQQRAGRAETRPDSLRGHGGQSVQAYHGPANPNATSKEDE